MKNFPYPRFTICFIILCSVVIIAEHFKLTWTYYLTKPLVLIIVAVFFHIQSAGTLHITFRNFMVSGFIFCAVGDLLLMFVPLHEKYFTFGLIAFLFAHICYTGGFILQIFKFRPWNQHWGQLAFSTLIVVYGAEFFILSRQHFGNLVLPVLIYCISITAMGVAAIMRNRKIYYKGYGMVSTGALLFIVSDSILATNKFIFSFDYSGTLILLTYFTAQYFIATGCAIEFSKENVTQLK